MKINYSTGIERRTRIEIKNRNAEDKGNNGRNLSVRD
jgi:hypothetical protein